MLKFECECGNTTRFFATGDYLNHNTEFLDLEDDDCITYKINESSLLIECKFCKHKYVLPNFTQL